MAVSSDSTEYESLLAALAEWEKSKNRPELWPEVESVATSLVAQLGPIIRAHVPSSDSYIGLTFLKQPETIGAYVSVGHVDHIVEIDGSFVPDASPNYWRTPLSASWASKQRIVETIPEGSICPKDNIEIPKYAECHLCGWSPSSQGSRHQ
jgi:hypothetical protein